MKTSTFNIRIETDLRDAFNRAAEAIHRPAAQVARDLIRDFVAKSKPKLSATELLERREAVDFSRGNSELEGFSAGPEFDTLSERYAAGEIEMEDLWRHIEEKIGHLRVKQDAA